MKRLGWIFLFIFCSQGWAMTKNLAHLKVEASGESPYTQVTELKPAEPLKDPLLCRVVANKLQHLQRVERQLVLLREKIAAGADVNAALKEIDVLEERRQQSYDFLTEPAPVMVAEWSLEKLWDPLLENLQAGVGEFQLNSYALLWVGLGESFATPDGTATILVDDWKRTLTLVLKGNVASYCSRGTTRLDFQL